MTIGTKDEIRFSVLATDSVVFGLLNGELKVLLVEVDNPKLLGKWATPGGLVKPEQKMHEAMLGKVSEEVSVDKMYWEQVETFGDPGRDPGGRVVSVCYLGLLSPDSLSLKTDKASWFSLLDLPELAYDGKKMIEVSLNHLKMKLEYSDLISKLMSDEFTLSELQKTYELVLGRGLDKRNFRKKIKTLEIVKPLGRKKKGEAYRPAELYGFI
jgi:8-oxo-dGTP diphosphatase